MWADVAESQDNENLNPNSINLITHSFLSAVCTLTESLNLTSIYLVTHLLIPAVCTVNNMDNCLLYQHCGCNPIMESLPSNIGLRQFLIFENGKVWKVVFYHDIPMRHRIHRVVADKTRAVPAATR